MKPLVSIVIPCYNAEPFLSATIESALAQTWPRKEVIFVNDGSTDASLALARTFESKGIQIIDQLNRGASAARNIGLAASKGDYLQFLDADDLLSPEKIAAQIEVLDQSPLGLVATCAWGRFEVDPREGRFIDSAVYRDFTATDFLVLAGETGAMVHPAAWLIPRPVALQAGPWDETLTVNDDGEYFCRVILAGGASVFSDRGFTFYRSGNASSLSKQRSDAARRSHYRSIQLIESHLRAAEDSPRTRRAMAGSYQRFIHDYFPSPPELITKAESDIRRLGGASFSTPAMGPKTTALANLIGWRSTWRLKRWFLGR